jgi:hypothetical protein
MASTYNISNSAASDAVNAVYSRLSSGGTMAFYDGTQPTTADIAITTQTLLATLHFGAPAFQAAVNGAAAANAIAPATGIANGTPTWFRLARADGTAVADGSVGTSGCDCNLDQETIQSGALVSVTQFTVVERKS